MKLSITIFNRTLSIEKAYPRQPKQWEPRKYDEVHVPSLSRSGIIRRVERGKITVALYHNIDGKYVYEFEKEQLRLNRRFSQYIKD